MVEPASVPVDPPRRKHAAAVLLLLLGLLLLLLWDWNWFKGPVQRAVGAATGREFRIEGDLDVELGVFRPVVIANGVVLGNTDWAEEREMFRADHARIEWAVWHILRGKVVLPELRLTAPVLNLERDAEGRANWSFKDEPETDPLPTSYPDIDQLWINEGRFRLVEATYRTDLEVAVRSGEPYAEGRRAPLLLAGGGIYRDNGFKLEGRIASPVQLVDTERPFRINLEASAGGTRARLVGAVRTPLQLQDFDLGFDIAGGNMGELYTLLGLAIPDTPAYALEGRLARIGQVWSYRDVTGTVGDSDIAGEVTVDASGARTLFTADLVSERLDLDDLAGFIGGTPQIEGSGSGAPGGRLFPSTPYDTTKLRAMDADVRLVAKSLISPTLPLESMDAHLKLKDGDLLVDPVAFGMAGGEVEGRIHLDAREQPIAADIQAVARRLDLPKLFPGGAPESEGRIGGKLDIRGRGNSVAALMATADGEFGIAMGRGRISNLTLELAGLDFAEALRFMIGEDRVIPVHCGFGDFEVSGGVMTARDFAFDTTDTIMLAEGSINLGDESFDLILKPRPKDFSPFTLRSPLRVGGTFRDPTIRPQGGPLILRAAAAVALYSLAPPAALIALVETGPGEDADCVARESLPKQ
jgi:uncharacterized protein involved in outer membrane biogenesis